MATRVLVPQLGEGVEEVTILQWLVNEGDSVEEYDGLVEVETDKVVTEIPSPTTGSVLKIEIPEATTDAQKDIYRKMAQEMNFNPRSRLGA